MNDPIKRNNQSNSLLSFKEYPLKPEVKASFTHNIKGRIIALTALDTSLSFSANTPTADLTEHAESVTKSWHYVWELDGKKQVKLVWNSAMTSILYDTPECPWEKESSISENRLDGLTVFADICQAYKAPHRPITV